MASSSPSPDESFLWGVASSAFQMEGAPGADWAVWDPQAQALPAMNGHWERFREDVALLAGLGVNAYRFSVEWSRLEPRPGVWDRVAAARYVELVRLLRGRGIEPIVTLHHFTNPRWFQRHFPWHRPGAAVRFAAFAARVADLLPEVRWWITFNEPLVLLLGGYLDGCMPPGLRDHRAGRAALAGLLEGHALSAAALRRGLASARVGVAHNMAVFEPDRVWHPLDRILARRVAQGYNRALIDSFRTGCMRLAIPFRRPEEIAVPGLAGSIDFLGVNYYQRIHLRFDPRRRRDGFLAVRHRDRSRHGLTDMGWETHPAGLAAVLREASAAGVPLLVTENGIATEDDRRKEAFIREHLAVLDRCRRDGLDVRGYCYWTLMDNYEWLRGFDMRFGLYRVDWDTGARVRTRSAEIFADLVRGRRAAHTGS